MRDKKKSLALAVALIMILSLFLQSGVTSVTAEEVYPFTFGGQNVNSENIESFTETGTIAYDPATKTLTLNGATIKESLIIDGDITINLVGSNSIAATNEATPGAITHSDLEVGIKSNGNITFGGAGSIVASGAIGIMISDINKKLIVNSGSIEAIGDGAKDVGHGIHAGVILNDGSLTATATDGYGIHGSILMQDGKLLAKSTNGFGFSTGITVNGGEARAESENNIGVNGSAQVLGGSLVGIGTKAFSSTVGANFGAMSDEGDTEVTATIKAEVFPFITHSYTDFSYAKIYYDPGTTDPGTTDPGTTDPGTTDPGTTDPGTTDPGTTDPGTTDPGTSDPGTTDPGTTNPGTTDPGTTYPGTTDPGTTNPDDEDENTDQNEEEDEDSGKIPLVPLGPGGVIDKVELDGNELEEGVDFEIDENNNLIINPDVTRDFEDGRYLLRVEVDGIAYETELIVENGIPLSAGEFLEIGGAWSLFDLIMTILAVCLALLYTFVRPKKNDEEVSEEATAEEEEVKHKKRLITNAVLLVLGVFNIILLLLTQDFTQPMTIFDEYSILFAIVVIVQVAIMYFFRKRVKNEENGEYGVSV